MTRLGRWWALPTVRGLRAAAAPGRRPLVAYAVADAAGDPHRTADPEVAEPLGEVGTIVAALP